VWMPFGDSASLASVSGPGGTSTAGEQLKNPWGWRQTQNDFQIHAIMLKLPEASGQEGGLFFHRTLTESSGIMLR
jgi:hypothetical protein